MNSAVQATRDTDHTELRHVLRSGTQLGVIQSVLIGVFAILQPRLVGAVELLVLGAILVLGIVITITLPGLWTKARTIEGISGAAGIGLWATVIFLVVDVAVFQPFGFYTNRWLEIGGGSNWWYHPIWWMVGTYLPWLGAWVLANQAAKSGAANPVGLVVGTLVLATVIMVISVLVGVPGASYGLGTFGIAVLPALAVLVAMTALGTRRG